MFLKSAQKATLAFLLAYAMLACLLAGCGKGQVEPEPAGESTPLPTEASQNTASSMRALPPASPGSPSGGGELETANLMASISDILESGFVARPAITSGVEGGQTAAISLEDDTADITVTFNDETVFEIVAIDRATYEETYTGASHTDVKIDNAVYVWGSYSGTQLAAARIVIVRYV